MSRSTEATAEEHSGTNLARHTTSIGRLPEVGELACHDVKPGLKPPLDFDIMPCRLLPWNFHPADFRQLI